MILRNFCTKKAYLEIKNTIKTLDEVKSIIYLCTRYR